MIRVLVLLVVLPLFACHTTQVSTSDQQRAQLGNESELVKNSELNITSFEECVAAGNPIMRSLPPKCSTKEGVVFVDKSQLPKIPMPNKRSCKDLCGDGSCQEMVCMAVGCPCPESSKTCPQDCG